MKAVKEFPCGIDVAYNLTDRNEAGDLRWRQFQPWRSFTKAEAIEAADNLCYDQDAAVHVWQNGTCIHTAYPRGFKLNP